MSYYDPYQSAPQQSMDQQFRQFYPNEPAQDFLQPQYQQENTSTFDYYKQIGGELNNDYLGHNFLPSNEAPAPFYDDASERVLIRA